MADLLRQPTTSQRNAWVRLCQWLFRGLLFIWITVVLGLAINVGATWLTTKGFDPTGTPLEFIIQHLPVAIACGGGLLVLTIVAYMFARQDESSVAHSQPTLLTQQNRSVLIHLLRNEYRRQMDESLQGATMMTLVLQQRTDVVHSSVSLVSWPMDVPGEASLPAPALIVQAYDNAGGGMLILGAPGAGKSMLLRELTSELLTRAEDDATQLIPVNVNLSSWAIKKPLLTAWMVDQLWETYHIPPRLSQALIEQNQLLFLLDGLDEVESSTRTKCVEAINAYLAKQEHIIPIVVCSRSHAYLEQQERLRLPIAVEVRPLTPEQVDGSLKGKGKPMAAVRTALKSNAVLRDLVTTPLMLRVVMLAYRNKTVKDLPQFGSAEDQQRQVFEYYVTRMLKHRRSDSRFPEQQTMHWLTWQAQQMKGHKQTEFYIERMQPDWLPSKRLYRFYQNVVSRLIAGVVFALLFGLLFGEPGMSGLLLGKAEGSEHFGFLTAGIGCVVGLIYVVLIGLNTNSKPTKVFVWSRAGFQPNKEEGVSRLQEHGVIN